MASTTVAREGGGGGEAPAGYDRVATLRLGQLFVLAVGVVLVVVVAGMLQELVTDLLQDVATGSVGAPVASPQP